MFDEETGLYYLRSRYYRAEWGRFVSADNHLVNSLYPYCHNMPIDRLDRDGHEDFSIYDVLDPALCDIYVDESEQVFHSSVTPDMQIYLTDPALYGYVDSGHSDPDDNTPGSVDCAYLMFLRKGGHSGSNLRYYSDNSYYGPIEELVAQINSGTDISTFIGYEVYQWRGRYRDGRKLMEHVGEIVLHDFGDGLELAVFQSVSTPIKNSKAYFTNDPNFGPNITSLFDHNGGTGAWTHYGIPKN